MRAYSLPHDQRVVGVLNLSICITWLRCARVLGVYRCSSAVSSSELVFACDRMIKQRRYASLF
jgi:hypothetical protein